MNEKPILLYKITPMSRRLGFTLIELLIVLIIIGVAVTLIVPVYQTWTIRSQGAEAKINLRALSDSAWQYHQEAGAFPNSMSDIDVQAGRSRYFMYFFSSSGTLIISPEPQVMAYCMILARHRDYGDGPVGAVTVYGIFFLKDITSFAGQPGEKMDENWYRYYLHKMEGTTGLKIGWP